ncbi:MAG: hypothetical protein NC321_08455 [Clostridium sp.]|nr:hypothetical protein [Clostridium sp.]
MVEKLNKKIMIITGVLFCTGMIFLCGRMLFSYKEQSQNTAQADSGNAVLFYENADKQGIERKKAQKYWKRILADNIFQDDMMMLTGLVINDMDKNGQDDLLVMILERGEEEEFLTPYGSGCVWIYMNEDEPYCFAEEEACYYGGFDFFAEDIDNDEKLEIVLSMQGTGCGAVGDSYKAVLKYQHHGFKRMELPSDLLEEYDRGITIMVYQEPEKNRYSAYCDYLKENLYFTAENVFEPAKEAHWVGGNVRGFYDLHPVKYQGKNALQASEYLSGEGGNVQCVALAQFIILWDEDGNPYIDKWWIEEKVEKNL